MEIVAAAKQVDGEGDVVPLAERISAAERSGARVVRFEVAPFDFPWFGDLPPGMLRGAFAPLEAMVRARHLLAEDRADLVVVHGADLIRTRLRKERGVLERASRVYDGRSFLEGYELVARAFLQREGLSETRFRALAASLFENYLRTWRRKHPSSPIADARWFEHITPLFRGVDCANPHVDFEGCLVLGRRLDALGFRSGPRVVLRGMAIEQACPDGIEHVATIATYRHLRVAYEKACREAAIDFGERFLGGHALVEVYTCYPVVPLAFLLRSGLVASIDDAPRVLAEHEITLDGGLNLARAPGNNTSLRALVDVYELLRDETRPRWAGIHSLGALGYVQAFCILERQS